VGEGDEVELGGLKARILEVGSHTGGHIAYFFREVPMLLAGDCLFTLGCARIFTGDFPRMQASLQKIRDLPDETVVYCAHECTPGNLKFALQVEPENVALREREAEVLALRSAGKPTVPTLLAHEKASNPFLRWDVPATTSWRDRLVRAAAGAIAASTIGAGAAAFAVDTSGLGIPGTWALKETRAGNLCEARATFTTDEPGSLEGSVTVRSPCFDTGQGVFRIVLEGDQPTFGWALDYEKSRVFYSATQVEAARPGGTVKARGIIRAAKRSEPDRLAPVGSFSATAPVPKPL